MNKLDLIRYIIKEYPYPEELSKARLNKIIYLVDWKSAIEHGNQLTDIEWVFNHFGPYVSDIEETILKDERFKIISTKNIYNNPKNIIKLCQDINFIEPNNTEKKIIDFIIDKTKKFYWDKFIELVYSTYPIISQERGSKLNLVTLAAEYNELKNNN
jgi:hypothetical protein